MEKGGAFLFAVCMCIIVPLGSRASAESRHDTNTADGVATAMWSTRNQLAVATITEAALSPAGVSYPQFTATVVSQLGTDAGNEPSFRQRLLLLPVPLPHAPAHTGDGPDSKRSAADAAATAAASITDFCDKHGDCNTVSWCYVVGSSAFNSGDGERRSLRLTFLSAGGQPRVRVWHSELALASGNFSTPLLLWPADDESPNAENDVMYYTASVDCRLYAFTYGERRVVNDTVRVVGEDVLIDVIQNAANAVKNVLCTADLRSGDSRDRGTGVTVECFNTNTSIGMAGWYISCWSHPSQFSFSPTPTNGSHVLALTHTKNLRTNDWADIDPHMGWSLLYPAQGKFHLGGDMKQWQFQPIWSRDGQFISFVSLGQNSQFWAWSQIWDICVASASDPTQAKCDSTSSVDREPNLIGFDAANSHILYTEQHKTAVTVNTVAFDLKTQVFGVHTELAIRVGDSAGLPLRAVSSVGVTVSASSPPATAITLVGESMFLAPEVYSGEWSTGSEHLIVHPISSLNADVGPNLTFTAKVINWPSTSAGDIMPTVGGILLSPAGGAKGKPLVAFAHPGPNMAHAETFLGWGGVGARYPVATLASMGYAVLMPNIRGSAGYGYQWRTSIYQDWGGGDLGDIFSGIDYVIKEYGASATAVHVLGWSYGGYLSAMALTQGETRFGQHLASVCVGGGITDLISHTGTADIGKILQSTFGGYYWNNDHDSGKPLLQLYENRSAMFGINDAKAPTLIHHGAHDPRVPILQAFQLHYALQAHGVTTRMLVYPGSGHIPAGNAAQLLDIWDSTVSWIRQHSHSPVVDEHSPVVDEHIPLVNEHV